MATRKRIDWFEIGGIIIFLIMIFALGYFTHTIMYDYQITKIGKEYNAKLDWCYNISNRPVDGLWLKNYDKEAKDNITQERDPIGEWVCVNIRGMTYRRAVEVCNHEVGHEMFAEICEKDIERCFETIESLNYNFTLKNADRI